MKHLIPKPNDREALLLGLFAWLGLILALVILFPGPHR